MSGLSGVIVALGDGVTDDILSDDDSLGVVVLAGFLGVQLAQPEMR